MRKNSAKSFTKLAAVTKHDKNIVAATMIVAYLPNVRLAIVAIYCSGGIFCKLEE